MCKKLLKFFRELFSVPVPIVDEDPSPCMKEGVVQAVVLPIPTKEDELITEPEPVVTTKRIPVPKKKKKYYYNPKSDALRKATKGKKSNNPK